MCPHRVSLSRFSKWTCAATFFLIFAGSLVTSTDSGLAVPDWPLSYGSFFPPMVGGVFYEHGHRMIAATVGFMMLVLAIWLAVKETRKWVKVLGFIGIGTVISQGLLGGITVLFYLPTAVSVGHAILAQTFFIVTIVLAYGLSAEWRDRFISDNIPSHMLQVHRKKLFKNVCFLLVAVYIQLFLGALMRHTGSGLAIPDFPTIAGHWTPFITETSLAWINSVRFEHLLDPVSMGQAHIHLLHRAWAIVVVVCALYLTFKAFQAGHVTRGVLRLIVLVDFAMMIQIGLGAWTILSLKHPYAASAHVLCGALILGLSVLMALRVYPFEARLTNEKKILLGNL